LAAQARSAETNGSAYVQQQFAQAQQRYQEQPTNTTVAWQLARATFDLAEFATNDTGRAQLADQGIAAARQALAGDAHSAAAHYYLGMNLGQLARTKGIGALKLVNQMEREFSLARDLDEHLDYGGPDRNLGLLYRDAPALVSIGNKTKAREHLQRALRLAPEFPENRLNLVEAELKWNERNNARRELAALEASWSKARSEFTGPAWEGSWADWTTRLATNKKRLDEPSRLESPRH
jgi:hypothetical protein